MSWDSWEETQRKNEEHRNRVEAERQQREQRLADEKRRLSEDRARAKEKKRIELKRKNEREERHRKRMAQSNASYEELLNNSKKEERKPQVSLNKFCGMRSIGFQGGFGQSGLANRQNSGSSIQAGGTIKTGGPQPMQQPSQGGGNKIVSSALLSGFRRF